MKIRDIGIVEDSNIVCFVADDNSRKIVVCSGTELELKLNEIAARWVNPYVNLGLNFPGI